MVRLRGETMNANRKLKMIALLTAIAVRATDRPSRSPFELGIAEELYRHGRHEDWDPEAERERYPGW
jgi:hypothetical protein